MVSKMMDVKSNYKLTDLGEIPNDWGVYPLKEIVLQIGDGNYSSKYPKNDDFIDFGIPFLRANNLKNGKLSMKDMRYISVEQHNTLKKGHIKVGDIIITVRGQIGNVAITTKEFNDVNMNAQLAFLRFNDQISSKFILYFFQTTVMQNLLFSITTGTALQQLPINRLKNISIIIPPLDEQQKIAEILSTVDEQIEQIDQLIEKTKELKKGLMQQLLTKGIGHTEFKQSEYGLIPNNWIINKVEYICDYRREKIDPLKSERQKYIALENIEQNTGRINGYLHSDDSTSMKSIFKKGDTIFNKLRPYLNKYWYATFDGVCATELLPLTSKNETDSLFLYYCLQQDRVLGYVTKRTFGTKMPRTSWKEIKEIFIPIPPIKEQKKIASILSSVDEDIDGYVQEKVTYEELKKGLMQQLLTGKTRVKVD